MYVKNYRLNCIEQRKALSRAQEDLDLVKKVFKISLLKVHNDARPASVGGSKSRCNSADSVYQKCNGSPISNHSSKRRSFSKHLSSLVNVGKRLLSPMTLPVSLFSAQPSKQVTKPILKVNCSVHSKHSVSSPTTKEYHVRCFNSLN